MMESTRDVVLRLRLENPLISASAIARLVNRSRERVRQILLSEGLETKRIKVRRFCETCGAVLNRRQRRFCSRPCVFESHYITIVCDVCELSFRRTKGWANAAIKRQYSHIFCTKFCQGRYMTKVRSERQMLKHLGGV